MTTDPPTAPAEGPGLEHRLARRADRYGLTVLIGAGVLLVAIGTGLVTGPLATLALTLCSASSSPSSVSPSSAARRRAGCLLPMVC